VGELDALAQSHKLKLSSIDTRDPHMKVLSDNLKQQQPRSGMIERS